MQVYKKLSWGAALSGLYFNLKHPGFASPSRAAQPGLLPVCPPGLEILVLAAHHDDADNTQNYSENSP
jgi:hypothetical protein